MGMNTPSEASAELARVVRDMRKTAESYGDDAVYLGATAKEVLTEYVERLTSLLSSHGVGGEAVAWMRRNVTYREGYGRTDGERIVSERKVYPDDLPLYLHPATPASAWRPIAEAPRDGTPVLLWDDHLDPGDLDIGYWSKQLGGYWVLYGGDDAHGCGFTATHWMPLPTPPTSTNGG